MTQLRINDEPIEGYIGDNVLQLAGQHGSHIWFVCDGRGLCQTCECRVLEGAESLSPATDLESRVLVDERRAAGFRLACQARITGNDPVSMVSRVEELRGNAKDAVIPRAPASLLAGMVRFVGSSMRVAMDILKTLPVITSEVSGRLASDPPTPSRIVNHLRDSARVAGRLVARP